MSGKPDAQTLGLASVPQGFVRLFVSLGEQDHFTQVKITRLIGTYSATPEKSIQNIVLFDTYSCFEVPAEYGEKTIAAFQDVLHNMRPIQIAYAADATTLIRTERPPTPARSARSTRSSRSTRGTRSGSGNSRSSAGGRSANSGGSGGASAASNKSRSAARAPKAAADSAAISTTISSAQTDAPVASGVYVAPQTSTAPRRKRRRKPASDSTGSSTPTPTASL